MADMTPLTDILNNDPATATPVQNNFQTIETYINGTDLVRTDGTEVMTANLDLDGNTLSNISTLAMNSTKITGLAAATAVGDAPRFDQTGISDYEVTSGGVTVTTGGATVDTISVTTPAAGLALVCCHGSLTSSGGSYGDPGGQEGMQILFSTSGTGGAGVNVGNYPVTSLTSDTTVTRADVFVVPLASGANTITVTATRSDFGSPGGTVTANTGYRTSVIGAF